MFVVAHQLCIVHIALRGNFFHMNSSHVCINSPGFERTHVRFLASKRQLVEILITLVLMSKF